MHTSKIPRVLDTAVELGFRAANLLARLTFIRLVLFLMMFTCFSFWYTITKAPRIVVNAIMFALKRRTFETDSFRRSETKRLRQETEGYIYPPESFVHAWDDRFDRISGWPFTPKFAIFKGLRMHYIDECTPGGSMTDKPTVLLLHGNPTWSFLYRKVIPTLCNSGHRVIALDWIGLGRSDKLKERADYDIELHITSLVAFVEGLQLSNVAVVGQDWGGAVALLSLSRFKPGTITGLCIVDSFVPSATLQDKSFNELLLYGIWLLSTTLFQRLVSVPLTIKFLGPSIPLTALIGYNAPFPSFAYKSGMLQWASLIALPYTSSPTVQRDAPVAILPGLANIMSRATKMSLLVHKFREAAKTFKHPVLVVYGQNDELFGDTLDTFLHPDLFPDDAFAAHGRQALLLKNAGHYCIEEKPMEFCMVLKNFLDGKKSAYEHVLHVTSRN